MAELEAKLQNAERKDSPEGCCAGASHGQQLRYGGDFFWQIAMAFGARGCQPCDRGRYQGEPVGNCHYSDITVFSFHPVKIIHR